MKILALDTSTLRAAIALSGHDDGDPVVEAPPDPDRRHGRGLIPAIQSLLDGAGLASRDLGAIAVGLGPGSYTGLRIGLTAAKTLAYAAGVPLFGLDSLHAIARNAPPDAPRVAVAVDAQRGDAYVAEFDRTPSGLVPLAPTRIEPAGAWASTLKPGTVVLGPALDRLGLSWPEGVRPGTVEDGHPQPSALVALARVAIRGTPADVWALEPTYLRRSAAEDQWDKKRS